MSFIKSYLYTPLIFIAKLILAGLLFGSWFFLIYKSPEILNLNLEELVNYGLFVSQLTGTIFALIMILIYSRFYSDIHLGNFKEKSSVYFAISIALLYLISSIVLPKEWYVTTIFNKPLLGQISVALTIFLIAPIGEEIVFRGFLLNPFLKYKKWVQCAGIIISSLLFAYIHKGQYHIFVIAQLFLFSVIISISRIKSGGILLPIILHIEASFLAVFFNKFL